MILFGIAAAIESVIPQSEILHRIQTVFSYSLFTLNEKTITLLALVKLLILLMLFALGSRLFRDVVLRRFFEYFRTDTGVQYTFSRVVHYLFMVVGVIIAFQTIGFNLSGLAVIFGFLSVGIGFGLQNITSNFVAGLILLFERPILVGDRVLVSDIEGDIEEIKIRATRIQTTDNISIIVPNSEFVSRNVINYSHGDARIRLNINVGVSYNSDLDKVLRSLKEVAQENQEVLKTPEPDVLLTNFGDSSWDMRLRVWIKDPKRHPMVRSNLNCAIVTKFRANNIEIPYPQRDLNFRNALKNENGRQQPEPENG